VFCSSCRCPSARITRVASKHSTAETRDSAGYKGPLEENKHRHGHNGYVRHQYGCNKHKVLGKLGLFYFSKDTPPSMLIFSGTASVPLRLFMYQRLVYSRSKYHGLDEPVLQLTLDNYATGGGAGRNPEDPITPQLRIMKAGTSSRRPLQD
jgi:hypothetical protein